MFQMSALPVQHIYVREDVQQNCSEHKKFFSLQHIGSLSYLRVIWLLATQPDIHGYIAIGYIATYTWLYSHVHLAIQPMAIQPCMSGYIAKSHITFPVWLYTPKERQLLEKAYIAIPNWLYSQTYQAIQPDISGYIARLKRLYSQT